MDVVAILLGLVIVLAVALVYIVCCLLVTVLEWPLHPSYVALDTTDRDHFITKNMRRYSRTNNSRRSVLEGPDKRSTSTSLELQTDTVPTSVNHREQVHFVPTPATRETQFDSLATPASLETQFNSLETQLASLLTSSSFATSSKETELSGTVAGALEIPTKLTDETGAPSAKIRILPKWSDISRTTTADVETPENAESETATDNIKDFSELPEMASANVNTVLEPQQLDASSPDDMKTLTEKIEQSRLTITVLHLRINEMLKQFEEKLLEEMETFQKSTQKCGTMNANSETAPDRNGRIAANFTQPDVTTHLPHDAAATQFIRH